MKQIGIVRERARLGEIHNMELFDKYNLNPTLISPKNSYSKSIESQLISIIPKYLNNPGQFKIPILSKFLQYRYAFNDYMFGFDKAVKDMDLLLPVELCSMGTYQSIKSGTPTIVKVWENIPYNWVLFPYSDKIKKINNPKFTEIAINQADFFLPVSELSKKVLLFHGVEEERIEVIGEPVDTSLFRPMDLFREDIFTLLFIGRLSWDKGINNLLFAIKSLIDDNVKLKLIIIGEGELKSSVEETIYNLKLHNNVVIIPFIDHTKLTPYYNKADVFVLPSMPQLRWMEQWGKVLTEAMACEIPVISTYSGTIPELVKNGKTGLLVHPYSWIELKKAILRLKENKSLRKKLGKNARKSIAKFDTKIITKKLVKIYKSKIS